MKVFLIAGARPNFMKIAPIARAFDKNSQINYKVVHTGTGVWKLAGLLRYEILCGLYTPQPSAETFFLLTLNLMGAWCGNLDTDTICKK
ncbi:hypothetical protein [Desulfobacula sp.]|uniref:hypothetical protein n=1 Tax=Desulfobacula sp. TaxID=2593537 RepID=UPI0039B857FB